MRTDIIEYLQKEIRARCEKPSNKFGIGCYYHIEAVVKNAELLAEQYGADKEVAVIAAWLHDIASVTDYSLYEEHHIHGAEIAGDILEQLGYDNDKIVRVQGCIRNHRGSTGDKPCTKEEICVADADAISHFDSVPSLLFLAYSAKGMDFEAGKSFVADKLKRSFAKLSEESKAFYRSKYEQVMDILGEK
ncbi:MAG: HD domain-containing protein [Ruminococcus sp.]|nr:HD domain-containing protein [Ruminococcus sp.]